jgi:tetratricopeptide (TPR) repeat protein
MVESVTASRELSLRHLVEAARCREALAFFFEWGESPEPLTTASRVLAARAACRIGEFELGTVLARMGQAAYSAEGDCDGVMECTNLLGALAFERGRIEDAEAQFRQVVALAEDAQHPRFTARAANNLGNIAHLRGEGDLANYLYEKALQSYHVVEDRRGIAETWHNLSLSHRETKPTEHALETCARAIAAAESIGSDELLALAMLGRAELLIERGALDQAGDDIERAQLLAWFEGNQPHVLEADRLRALAALRGGDAPEAHRRAEWIRKRATEAGFALIAAEAASISARALKEDRRLPEAVAANELALASFRALGATGLMHRHESEWEGATN